MGVVILYNLDSLYFNLEFHKSKKYDKVKKMINYWTRGFYGTGCIESRGYNVVIIGAVIIGIFLFIYKGFLSSKN